ncbi:MAG: hypothetical protein Alpg2KO_13110 [Alphaproteobacteria bacterium]
MTSPSEILRKDTRVEHRRIGGSPIMRRLFQADYTKDEYRDLLIRFYGIVKPLEDKVERMASADVKAVVKPRFKAGHLECDLMGLGMTAEEIKRIPLAPIPRGPMSDEAVLGLFYVTEGQTQGGKIISRGLRKKFGDELKTALNFYDPYGDKCDAKWAEFKSELDYRLDTPRKLRAAVIHANNSFRAITGWLTRDNPMMSADADKPATPPKTDRRRKLLPTL